MAHKCLTCSVGDNPGPQSRQRVRPETSAATAVAERSVTATRMLGVPCGSEVSREPFLSGDAVRSRYKVAFTRQPFFL